jgi:membrane protease YdiL (CAAX protease family)
MRSCAFSAAGTAAATEKKRSNRERMPGTIAQIGQTTALQIATFIAQTDVEAITRITAWVFGVVLGIDALLGFLTLYARIRGKRSPFAPVWSVTDIWFGAQITLIVLAFAVVPLFLIYLAVDPNPSSKLDSPKALLYFVLPSVILQNVVFFGVPAVYIVAKYGQRLRDIGLPALPRGRDWTAGLILGAVGFLAAHLVGAGIEVLAERFRHIEWVRAALEYESSNPVAQIVAALPKLGLTGLILAVLGIGIGAPLGEEMFFRGFAFNALKRRFGVTAGLIVSALLFTLPHTYVLGLLPVFLLGMLLAWTYHNSGSLWVPIIIHATNNTASVLLAFFVPALAK